jgi:amino acid adenylation domain-containing protein
MGAAVNEQNKFEAASVREQIAGLSVDARKRFEERLLNSRGRLAIKPTITRRINTDFSPLSLGQERLFFLHQLEPNSAAYNEPKAFRINGELNLDLLTKVIKEILRRHEILRSAIRLQDGVPIQRPNETYSIELPVIDISDMAKEERERDARRIIAQVTERPFDLSTDVKLRAVLLRLERHEHILLLVTHHIVSDGPSRDILFRELTSLYDAYSSDKPSPLPELPIQYGDYSDWQRKSLTEIEIQRQLSFWNLQLDEVPAILSLPLDRSRATAQTFSGASETTVLGPQLTGALRSLSRRQSTSLFMTLLAAFDVLLWRYTGEKRFVVGVPFTERKCAELENLVGYFVSSLLIRVDFSGRPTFRELLDQVRATALSAYAHPDIPFEKLVEKLHSGRSLSAHPMFQVMFALRGNFTQPIALSGLTFTPVKVETETSKFDLTLTITERTDDLVATFKYNSDLFDAATIQRMAIHFVTLLEAIVRDPTQPVDLLPVLTDNEREQLLVTWNDSARIYSNSGCVHELFETQAERAPDDVAIWFDGESISYGDLNRRANQLAHYLRNLGVGADDFVAIFLNRSVELIVALLGTLKAGAAYVPLDPKCPADRLAFLLDDFAPLAILTEESLNERLPIRAARVICLDSQLDAISQESTGNPVIHLTPNHLAYMIYTSGSTGEPKGVEITHGGLSNYVQYAGAILGLHRDDRILQFAPIIFDTAAEEIFPCLARGAKLVLRTDSMLDSMSMFIQKCHEWQITIVDLPTAFWHELTDTISSEKLAIPQQLRLVFVGGETALSGRFTQWRNAAGGQIRFLNGYGPTETTVVATIWEASDFNQRLQSRSNVPLGRPIANTKIFILDPFLQPVPVGAIGELHIGGVGLARGYHNRPELTAQKFIPNPFSNDPNSRLYKTGDLARYLPDGNIEFIGRNDNQVKIRGYRIELGEIESLLCQHPDVRQAVVLAQEVDPQDLRLVSYIVTSQKSHATIDDLKTFLKRQLPDYMVPTALVFLDSLPLTSNGKVDRKALPPPDRTPSDSETVFVAPRDEIENQLAKIWESVLGIQSISVTDNYFDLGGHSLLAIKLFAEIEKATGEKLPVATIFQTPTIEQLAEVFRLETSSMHYSSLVPIQPHGSKPPLFLVHGADGGVFDFTHLARHMEPDQPLYGLQSPGYDGEQEPLTQIESIAAHYVDEIRKAVPQGPYLLAGLCLGGTVAFEMSQQLHAQGQKVALLTLVDTPRVTPMSVLGTWMLPYKKKLRYHVVERFLHHKRYLQGLGFREQLGYVMSALAVAKRRLDLRQMLPQAHLQITKPKHRAKLDNANLNARRRYSPRQYAGAITLLLAQDSPVKSFGDRRLAWRELALGGVEVDTIPGNHKTMIWDPHAQILAQKLKVCIEKAITTNEYQRV